MIKLTKSFAHWLWKYHRESAGLIIFGHIELLNDDMWNEYIEWLQTDDGKQYLRGGSEWKH